MHIEYVKTFCILYENNGSVQKAAELVSTTPELIKNHIRNLENHLKTKLFYSKRKRLFATEEATSLYQRVNDSTNHLLHAINEFQGNKSTLRISTTQAFLTCWFPHFFNSIFKEFPQVEFTTIDQPVDLLMRDYDLYIASKISDLGAQQVYKQHLCQFHIMLFASKAYIERHGAPKLLTDLERHKVIRYQNKPHFFTFEDPNYLVDKYGSNISYLRFNAGFNILQAIESGLGIGPISIESAMSSSLDLIPVLAETIKPQKVDIECFSRYEFKENNKSQKAYTLLKTSVDLQLKSFDEKYERLSGTTFDR